MVKAEYKRDYYADLDLTNSADQESIKRRFRELAKQYHPDRNPGHEADVLPKFQAIQQAHELLTDPAQKVRYDAERAKLNQTREPESAAFKKPAPPRRTDSGFPTSAFAQSQSQSQTQPNAGRRDQSANRYAPQNPPPRSRPNSAASPSADKFAQFARAAPQPQQWDRTRFEEAARAEGLRGMRAMRGGAVPQTSPLRSRPPTATKPSAAADPYSSGPDHSPGFPGLNRSASRRDVPPTSAYAHLHRDRPLSSDTRPSSEYWSRDSDSNIRKNNSFQNFADLRPGLSRNSSRYAQTPGERTDLNSNIGRSESVKDPPTHRWHDRERGPFGAASSASDIHSPKPRPRSHSPQARTRPQEYHYESESTSSDEEQSIPPRDRKKVPLRRPRTFFSNTTSSSLNSDDPGLTGYFPNTNYTRIVDESSTYQYPKPDDKSPPTRRPFSMFSPGDEDGLPQHDSKPSTHNQEDHPPTSDEAPKHESTEQPRGFDPSEWQDTFENNTEIFHPPETTARDRKSPSKGSRSSRSGQSRTYNLRDGRRETVNGDSRPDIASGVRHVDPQSHKTSSTFAPGKLPSDFAEKINGTRRPSAVHNNSYGNGHSNDEMDVDSPAPASDSAASSTVQVTVEEELSDSQASPRQPRQPRRSRGPDSNPAFNLDELKSAGPFAPSHTGLHDLDDIGNSLPFTSKPAEGLEALHNVSSSTLRDLNLPRKPIAPLRPSDDNLTSETWNAYISNMTKYMEEWKKFNGEMMSHFNSRQEAMTHHMFRNWLGAQSDGASAESFEASHGKDLAGFGTYMAWLEDDRKCRMWWDVACEQHKLCMEDLGKVRSRVKEIRKAAAV